MRIKWLHLSDIHFNYKNFESHSLREDFLTRIQSLSQSEPFTHLFITGDILYRNQKADQGTIDFIKKLIKCMHLPITNVFLVPGNHDHDRDITRSIINKLFEGKSDNDCSIIDNLSPNDTSALLENFSNYCEAYFNVMDEECYSDKTHPHIVKSLSGLSIIEINTSWLDIDSSKEQDYLQIGTRLLQSELSNHNELVCNSVNIALGHHPFEEMIPQERERVLNQLARNNIGLYFCGHRHKPDIIYHSKYDVVEIIAPGGYNDGYSDGGYVCGIIDTDVDFYKAEVYGWYNNKWCIESKLDGTNEYGIFYFHSKRFNHRSEIVAIDCKIMNGHIPKSVLEDSIGCSNFDVYVYNGPANDINGYSQETITDFSKCILKLVENNKKVHLFPLAPIPMLINLGFNLQNNATIIVHQYDRSSNTWVFNEKQADIHFNQPICEKNNSSILVVSISTSFRVEMTQIKQVLGNTTFDFVQFQYEKVAPGFPLYNQDINNAVSEIMEYLNPIASAYSEIHFFAAIPAGMAVELGRNLLKTVYRNVHLYQFSNGKYEDRITLNPVVKPNVQNTVVYNAVFLDVLTQNSTQKISILGAVPCGKPNIEEPENNSYYPMPDSMLGSGQYFALRAVGDSMIDAGINDGDTIIVKSQPVADNGEIVVALIDGEFTIKRFYRDEKNQRFILHPENKKYTDMELDELTIQGVAVHVIKKL